MGKVYPKTLAFIALACACCVLFAGTAHLLHCHLHFAKIHKHGKAVPDVVSSLATFSLAKADLFSGITPLLSIIGYGRLDLEAKDTRDDDILRVLIGRAPPAQS